MTLILTLSVREHLLYSTCISTYRLSLFFSAAMMTQTSPLLSQPALPYPSKDFVHKVTFPLPVLSAEWIIRVGIWTCQEMSFWQMKKLSLDLTTFDFFLTQPISLPPFQQTSKLASLLLYWNGSCETPCGFHLLQRESRILDCTVFEFSVPLVYLVRVFLLKAF